MSLGGSLHLNSNNLTDIPKVMTSLEATLCVGSVVQEHSGLMAKLYGLEENLP